MVTERPGAGNEENAEETRDMPAIKENYPNLLSGASRRSHAGGRHAPSVLCLCVGGMFFCGCLKTSRTLCGSTHIGVTF